MKSPVKIVIADLNLAARGTLDSSLATAVVGFKERGVPVVLCTTGTFAETAAVRHRFGLSDPLVVENGGAIYVPKGYFTPVEASGDAKDGYQKISLGLPYDQVVLYLALIKKLVSAGITGFSDMTDAGLAEDSGLSLSEARRARTREYDEPFKIAGNSRAAFERICRTVKGSCLSVTRGSRYYHLTGGCDKGGAVAVLRRLYQEGREPVRLAGVGTSAGDETLLANVDYPVVLATADGRHFPRFVQGFPQSVRDSVTRARNWEHALSALLHMWGNGHAG